MVGAAEVCTEASAARRVPAAASVQWSCCGVGVRLSVLVVGFFFPHLVRLLSLAAAGATAHVTSRDAGETRSHSSRERRLCHCSTAVRCALSIRRQWLDSGAPVEYWPMTILPMKSLLLFTLCPYTAGSRNGDRSRSVHHTSTLSPACSRMAISCGRATPAVHGCCGPSKTKSTLNSEHLTCHTQMAGHHNFQHVAQHLKIIQKTH